MTELRKTKSAKEAQEIIAARKKTRPETSYLHGLVTSQRQMA
jgi:phosphoribosyl-ATP pyrophosphohydrolase